MIQNLNCYCHSPTLNTTTFQQKWKVRCDTVITKNPHQTQPNTIIWIDKKRDILRKQKLLVYTQKAK